VSASAFLTTQIFDRRIHYFYFFNTLYVILCFRIRNPHEIEKHIVTKRVMFCEKPVTNPTGTVTMTNFHRLIMSAVKNNQQTQPNHNNVSKSTQPDKPRALFRLSSAYVTSMSGALHAQLTRYCEAERKTRSRAVRNAVYAVLENPSLLSQKPSGVPAIGQTPERTVVVSWTMPTNKPQDLEYLHNMCTTRGSQSELVRRALYLYTIKYKSTNPDEQKEAMRDAWM